MLVLVVLMRLSSDRFEPRLLAAPTNIMRSILEVAITFTFLSGVVRLPLATATTLFFTAPIFITLLAFLFLHERVGLNRWVAVFAGFVGVLLIAGPGGGFDPAMLLPLGAAAMTAGRDVLTRFIPLDLPVRAVAFSTATAVMLGGLASAPLGGWVFLEGPEIVGLVVCAGFLTAADTLLVSSVRTGEMSFIAPFRYFSIIPALVLGFIVWGDVPSPIAVAGGLVIIGSGFIIVRHERMLRKKT